jgi:hypothetical protein
MSRKIEGIIYNISFITNMDDWSNIVKNATYMGNKNEKHKIELEIGLKVTISGFFDVMVG